MRAAAYLSPNPHSKEERIKGYKVKVQYQATKEEEKKVKRDAVAQVIIQALKRMKDRK